jgi:hypothetical protein
LSIYNLACLVVQEQRKDEALALLREAVDNGLPPAVDGGMEKDTDLKSLKGDARFEALVAHAKETAAQKPRQATSGKTQR